MEVIDNQYKIKTEKEIALEEIQGIMTQLFPGQSAKEKKMKVDILESIFKTRSWTNKTNNN